MKQVLVVISALVCLQASGVGEAQKDVANNWPERARSQTHIDRLPADSERLRLVYASESVISAASRLKNLKAVTIIASPMGASDSASAATLGKLAALKSLSSMTFIGYELGPDHMAAMGKFAALDTLSFQRCTITNQDASGATVPSLALLKTCTKLRSLEFDQTIFGIDESRLDDFSSLPALRALNMGDRELGPSEVKLILRCTKLESLTFRTGSKYGRCEAAELAELGKLQALTSLNLKFFDGTPDLHAALGEALGKLKAVASLSLCYSNRADGVLDHLDALPALRSLAVSGNVENATVFGKLTNVERLEIDGTSTWDNRPAWTYSGAQLSWLKDLKKLKALSLRGGSRLGELPGHLAGLKNLRELTVAALQEPGDLSGLSKLTALESLNLTIDASTLEAAAGKIIAANAKLKSLQLQASGFGDPVAKAISGLKLLESLVLIASEIGAPAPGEATFEGLAALHSLELRGFSGVSAQAVSKLPTLTYLYEIAFHDCTGVCSKTVFQEIGKCSALTLLKVVGQSPEEFTGGTAAECVKALELLSSIEQLHLACALSDAALLTIGQMKSLRRLDLASCTGISEDGLAHLRSLINLQYFLFPMELFGSEGLDELMEAIPFSWSD